MGIAICKTKKTIKDEGDRIKELKHKIKLSERRIEFGKDYLNGLSE